MMIVVMLPLGSWLSTVAVITRIRRNPECFTAIDVLEVDSVRMIIC